MIKEYNFEKYFDCLLKIIPISIAALIALSVYRIFFFFHFADFTTLNAMTFYVLKAFWLGFRFDLAVVAYINSFVIVILTFILLFRSLKVFKFTVFIIKIYYWVAFSFLAFLAAVDFGFYTYFNERINILIFEFFRDDTPALMSTIVKDSRFPVAVIILFTVSVISYKLSSWTAKKFLNRQCIIDTSFWGGFLKTFIIIFTLFITFVFMRGTVSMFPLGIFHTQISPNIFINKISISPAHALTDAIQSKAEQAKTVDVAEKIGIPKEDINISAFYKTSQFNNAAQEIRPNVVFIVMEDFGELPVLYNSKKFDVLGELKKHFDEDIVFYNFLAAGRITIHALETTILNMPQRPYALQITQSPAAFNKYASASVVPYKNSGYNTSAIYGGSLKWRAIDSFFITQGFDNIYGEGDIKNEYRHQWGINDAQFFELVLRELKKESDAPKFIYGMSTGAHVPYETPPYYKPLPLETPKELLEKMPGMSKEYIDQMFKTYQFANREIAKFISAVKKSELADNTIIVVTGDHNLREFPGLTREELFRKYAVPLYIYVPKKLKRPMNINEAGSHTDIMPTLYDLSLSRQKYISAGTSLADNGKKHIAFNSDGFILSGNKAALYNVDSKTAQYFIFDLKTKLLSETQATKEHNDMIEYYKQTIAAADVYLNQKNQNKGE
ncbi:LTA synthase family protein [Endomicrobium proavitum]|uniref:Alkaline phosphatase superfamily protein n=1 Tax=Endomicrobium proavitum TaxID=1408281 RepID=A0A0G3WK71_9BACT|nr:LTA synthase family protein [Endomicrobium proavitum]AKL98277.1 alkaline phosphatase superfamily protein [Endomicrobium proavitum]